MFHSPKNGGATTAAKSFKLGRSACRGVACRELHELGSEAFIRGEDIDSPAPSAANGSIDVYVRDANLEFTLSYLPGADESSPTIGPNVTTNAAQLAKETLNNLQGMRTH
ncbi:hypothetical protein [Actinomadura opuntiae]|uniref:hypothetical protein n=1 Tax=Actinomadura sp. OS1-43 TaxID=604315 RepID=UPI00255A92D0|nr:hypothetical protein [Actinomadura sp. OS1-43]MDL4817678.1 hypothetical protein [Actinomadura sp. OS1-43]